MRLIRDIANDVLDGLSDEFGLIYSSTGRPSAPPEKLLRALLLQAFYSIRSERQLMEHLDFNLLYRWFVGLGIDEGVWDASTFCKNRDRLLQADIAAKFLNGIVGHKRVKRLLSQDHFSVDGTLIGEPSRRHRFEPDGERASMKSFRPKGEDDDGAPGGRNKERGYRGERRKNDTHASATDGDAKLYRRGAGKSAQLCFMGHALMESRHGLAVGAALTVASGTAEREATFPMLDHASPNPGATLAGDRAYDVWRFKQALKERGIVPHMAMRREVGWGGLPIPKPPGYDASQLSRKRIEEIFGWVKTIAGQAKTKFRGRRRVAASFTLAVAAYNLVRLPKLLAVSP